jgi:peptidoglycan/LPS O-acetylase OafA/YrhL
MTDVFTAPAVRAEEPVRSRNRLVAYLDPRTSVGRFRSLDGYRALAALGVVVHHVAGYAGLSVGSSFPAWAVYNLGNFGVATFFVLSGCLLYLPFVSAALRNEPEPEPIRFLWRRVLRIWPAYTLALGAFIALGVYDAQDPGPDHYFTLFSLTQIYRKAYGFTGLAVAWTLCVEVAFYLALPLLAGAIRALARGTTGVRARVEAQVVGLGVLVAVALVYRWFVADPAISDPERYPFTVLHLWLPNYLDWFALGMGLAVAVAWRDLGRPLPGLLDGLARYPWLCWVLGAGCYVALVLSRAGEVNLRLGLQESTGHYFARFALNGLGAFFILVAGVLGPERHPSNRVLSSFVFLYLGTISYGIYLWHKVWLDWLVDHQEAAPDWLGFLPEGRLGFWPMLGLVLAVTVVTATLSYYLFERIFLRFKRSRRARQEAA